MKATTTAIIWFILIVFLDFFVEEKSTLANFHVMYWPAFIAVPMFIMTIFTLPLDSWKNSINAILLSIFLFIISMTWIMTYHTIRGFQPASAPIPVESKNNCPNTIRKNKVIITQGHMKIKEYNQPVFIGTLSEWHEQEQALLDQYYEKYPITEYTVRVDSSSELPEEDYHKMRKAVVRGEDPSLCY